MKTTILENCAISVQPAPIPAEGGIEEGKQIRIDVLDSAGHLTETLLYPMNMSLAKKVGGDLLGIGQLAKANGHDIERFGK